MKFDHVVKYNGIRYAAGEEVPMTEEKPVQNVFAFAEMESGEPQMTFEESKPAPRRRGRAAKKE